MTQDLKTLVEPNTYEVSGDGTQISYSTSGIDGSPSFSYRGPKGDDQTFSGDDIQTLDTALGTEVTVTVADVADLHVIALTLVTPEMWIAPGSGSRRRGQARRALASESHSYLPPGRGALPLRAQGASSATAAAIVCGFAGTGMPATSTVGVPPTPRSTASSVTKRTHGW